MAFNQINRYTIKYYAPTILSALGYIGIAVTGILSFRAKGKYEEYQEKDPFDKTKNVVKAALPPVIAGAATTACFAISRNMDRKTIAALGASTAALSAQIAEMKKVMEEKLTEEQYNDIYDEYVNSVSDPERTIVIDPDGILYFEEYSNIYFRAKESTVLVALLHINHNYQVRGGIASLYEFFRVLGVTKADIKRFDLGWTEYIGWHANLLNGMYNQFTIEHIFVDEDKYVEGESFVTLEWDVPLTPICEDPPSIVSAITGMTRDDINSYGELMYTREDVKCIKQDILDSEVE